MEQQQNAFANGLTVMGYAIYPNLDKARDFKGNGDFRFDIQVVITAAEAARLNAAARELAKQKFSEAEISNPLFHWPAVDLSKEPSEGAKKILDVFPGAWVIKLARKVDKGAPVKKDATGAVVVNPGYINSGNVVACAFDMMTYKQSAKIFGVTSLLGEVAKLQDGVKVSLGSAGASLSAEDLAAAQSATLPGVADGAAAASPLPTTAVHQF